MSTPTSAPSTAEPASRRVMRRFPATPIWFGPFTGHWWALAADRLIEAETPEALGDMLGDMPRRPAGSWLPPRDAPVTAPEPAPAPAPAMPEHTPSPKRSPAPVG